MIVEKRKELIYQKAVNLVKNTRLFSIKKYESSNEFEKTPEKMDATGIQTITHGLPNIALALFIKYASRQRFCSATRTQRVVNNKIKKRRKLRLLNWILFFRETSSAEIKFLSAVIYGINKPEIRTLESWVFWRRSLC